MEAGGRRETMSSGNGKRLVPGLESYLKGSDFYKDPYGSPW
jgi:hypothetical protein